MKKVTQAEFARLCGVGRQTVSGWIKNGRIRADADGMIDPDVAQRMRLATESPLPHHQARKAQFDERRAKREGISPGADSDDSGDPDELESLGRDLKAETLRLQRHKTELAALEIDQIAGALVDRTDVDFVLADLGSIVRNLLEALPDRLAGELAALGGDMGAIHAALEDAARDVLVALSEALERRAAGLDA